MVTAKFPPCTECGRTFDRLFRYIRDIEYPTVRQNLTMPIDPNGIDRNVQMSLRKMKDFQAHYLEISEFSAWVCGVPIATFCLMDQINYIARVTGKHPFTVNRKP
jgi:hypothetical protein